MITCIAIDDEPLALKQLVNYIKRTPFLLLKHSCNSAVEAQDLLKESAVDVVFTDINMPDCNGLDFVKSLNPAPLVVFVTAYEEYAVESYRVAAVDYLLKPYSYQDFQKVALKVKQFFEMKIANSALHSDEDAPRDYIFVRADNQSVKIHFDRLVYVEAMSEYIRLHFDNGKSLMTFLSIKLMMESLPADRFMRVHRSFIIALDRIETYSGTVVYLQDGTQIPVSASHKPDLQKFIEERSLDRKSLNN